MSAFVVSCPIRHKILGMLCKNPPFNKTTDSALCNEALVDQLWKLMNSGETHTRTRTLYEATGCKILMTSCCQQSVKLPSFLRDSWQVCNHVSLCYLDAKGEAVGKELHARQSQQTENRGLLVVTVPV